MSTLRNLVKKYGDVSEADIDWLDRLVADWPLLADLAFGDVVLWAPTTDDSYIAVAHARPASTATLFYRDVLGDFLRSDWRDFVDGALEAGTAVESTSPAWYEEVPMKLVAYPVHRRDEETGELVGPIAVVTHHANLSDNRSASRIESAFKESADDLFTMIGEGTFPEPAGTRGSQRGAPRASDGLIRLDTDGEITFASPNTQTTFTLIGYRDEMEGEHLSDVVAEVLTGQQDVNESLPLITDGKAARRADVEARGRVVTMRSIVVYLGGERTGAIILTRDITELRQQEQELITKDATIREIHHRVKNNLQTVASLLRIQARRAKSEDAKEALSQAMRRVAAIAVVHDTLSTGLSQIVDFDDVFDRVLLLVTEVASIHNTTVHPKKRGSFGELPSEYATPLSLALTEVVTNAVEHGLAGREGEVVIEATRDDRRLTVLVLDTGTGLPGGIVGDGLGTQIVRTLIQGELGGTITWGAADGGGTKVTIDIPLRWMSGLDGA